MEYNYKDGSKLFFTSDTHFNHNAILKYCDRPFSSIEEMNETIVKNWNEKVPNDGIVFHLGDFAWGGFEVYKDYVSKLNGNIVLVKGNHDERNGGKTSSDLFYYTAYQLKLTIEGRGVYLNHYPFLCYGGTYGTPSSNVYQLFGHVHTHKGSHGLDDERLKHLFPTQYDVGVDNNDFTPLSWKEVREKIGAQLLKKKFEG